MRKWIMKLWSKHIYRSSKGKVEEGTSSTSMTENQFNKLLLFLQVIREVTELNVKHREDYLLVDAIGSHRYEKFGHVMECISEVEKFLKEIEPELYHKGNEEDSFWCQTMILRIRKIRAKRSPNLTLQRVSNVGSSSSSSLLSLREEFYSEITSLNIIYFAWKAAVVSMHALPSEICNEEIDQQLINEVEDFMEEIKYQLEKTNSETISDWYRKKIEETRMLIDKCEPEFSLQSHDHVGLSTPLSLHEELRCEMRLLVKIYFVDLMVVISLSGLQDLHRRRICSIQVQQSVDEMEEFITETKLQLVEKNYEKNSDWYRNKIAETRTLIAKRYSALPLRSQDVGYTNEQFQIFLSFRGEDTRYGFTRNLYDALRQEGFKVFMDDEGLQSGDSISQVLMGAIENSKLSIIVFSENFADSSWCLDEVVKILECKQQENQQVWPIFYKVEPSDVRHQRNSYEKALIKQETRFGKDSDKVKNWRSALYEVCGLKAFHYKENSGYEGAFIQDVIKSAKHIRDHL